MDGVKKPLPHDNALRPGGTFDTFLGCTRPLRKTFIGVPPATCRFQGFGRDFILCFGAAFHPENLLVRH